MLAVVILIGAVAAVWGVQTLVGKSMSAADRAVRRKTHTAGRATMASTLNFTAPVSSRALATKIVSTVNAHPSAPAAVNGLFLRQQSEQMVAFSFGSKLNGALMTAHVGLSETAQGVAGTFEVDNWSEDGATVVGAKQVELLTSRIRQAVVEVGGRVT